MAALALGMSVAARSHAPGDARVTAAQPIIPAYVALSAPTGHLNVPAIWWPRIALPPPAKASVEAASIPQVGGENSGETGGNPGEDSGNISVITTTPPPSTPAPANPGQIAGNLRSWLAEGGFSGDLLDEAVRVAAGSSNCPNGESGGHPDSTNGRDYGLFELDPLWFSASGEDFSRWADPVVNARVAFWTVQYDLARGYPAWAQWACQP